MSKQVLRVKYHPAKKEIIFQRLQGETIIPIPIGSRLLNYMRGEFILQDQCNDFLSDIAKTFKGERIVNLEVTTTKTDYEDFDRMVKFYNEKSPKIKIDIAFLAELRNMDEIYTKVKEHGERSIGILEHHRANFFNLSMDNDKVNECITLFDENVKKEVKSIKDKIKDMEDNNVNLCFAGVYSSGKSALINAILGYPILPVALESKTARMFRIQSPRTGEKVRIVFQLLSTPTELVWNDSAGVFEFSTGHNNSSKSKSIRDVIYKNRKEPQYRQILEILNTLNADEDVKSYIQVYFPVPLDNDKLQFTIFDTPGTDSNYGDHRIELQKAIYRQTHSILVFVGAPLKLEGKGNSALLNDIKEAEKKDDKTCIDLGRSLFVMNMVDSLGPKAREGLQNAVIKTNNDDDGDSFSIKLSDKKLFFTSAKMSYCAKAKKKGIPLEEDDEVIFEEKSGRISDKKFGRYYQQNLCAKSELEKERVIEEAALALEKAEKNGDTLEVIHISSGVYSLEKEIVHYGEKYAAAVRAFAIIQRVDEALSTLKYESQSLKKQNEKELRKVNEEISSQRSTILDSIEQAYKKYEIRGNDALPPDILEKLHLNSFHINSTVGKALFYIKKLVLKWFFNISDNNFLDKIKKIGFLEKILEKTKRVAYDTLTQFIDDTTLEDIADLIKEVRFNDKHKHEINQHITAIVNDFTGNYRDRRQDLLEKQRDAFINDVKQAIDENGQISNDAKDAIFSKIRKPKVEASINTDEIDEKYDSHKRVSKFFKKEYVNTRSYLRDLERTLKDIANSSATDFMRDYRESLKDILNKVKLQFSSNLDTYSVVVKAKLDDSKTMELFGERINEAVAELEGCQRELDDLIWSEKNSDR